jgi:hypothetical protein
LISHRRSYVLYVNYLLTIYPIKLNYRYNIKNNNGKIMNIHVIQDKLKTLGTLAFIKTPRI